MRARTRNRRRHVPSWAALQRELAVPLVTRQGRDLQLTPSGQVFAGYARRLLGLLDEAKDATLGQLHPERGRVRLAAVTTAGEHVLPRFLATFREEYPMPAEELLDELSVSPTTLNLGSNGAIRESVLVGLGITLISRDAVARELDDGTLGVDLRHPPPPAGLARRGQGR